VNACSVSKSLADLGLSFVDVKTASSHMFMNSPFPVSVSFPVSGQRVWSEQVAERAWQVEVQRSFLPLAPIPGSVRAIVLLAGIRQESRPLSAGWWG